MEQQTLMPAGVRAADGREGTGRHRRRGLVALAALLQACTSILHVPDGATYASPDGQRSAQVRQGRVHIGGQPDGPAFDGITGSGVQFSADGKRLAYIGMRGSKHFLVVDGREHGPFDGISKGGVAFSPGGGHVALPVVQAGRWQLWLDGQLSRPFDGIGQGHPVFSRGDARVAYAVRDGTQWSLVVDGAQTTLGPGVLTDDVGFTADGTPYVAYRDTSGWRVRLGDRVGDAFDAIHKPGIMPSASGRSIAFIARRGDQVFVCVDLACGKAHRMVGTRVLVESSIFGNDFWKALGMTTALGVVAGLAGALVPAMSVSGGGSARYTIVGSVVFSNDDRHHAYVASDPLDVVVVDGGLAQMDVAPGQRVEWMRFDDRARVLMVRTSGAGGGLHALPLPGTPVHTDAGAAAATLALKLPEGGAVVFVDERFAGVSPASVRVGAGTRVLRMQAPGRPGREVRVEVAAGESREVDLDAPLEPVRAAVQAALAQFGDTRLPTAAKAGADQLWRARVLAAVPLSEDVLGVALYGAGTDALVFGEQAIHVHSEYSSRAGAASRHAVSYAEFARRALPSDHRAFEVTLTPAVVIKTAGMSLAKERLIEFLQILRTHLVGAGVQAVPAVGAPR